MAEGEYLSHFETWNESEEALTNLELISHSLDGFP